MAGAAHVGRALPAMVVSREALNIYGLSPDAHEEGNARPTLTSLEATCALSRLLCIIGKSPQRAQHGIRRFRRHVVPGVLDRFNA